MVRLIWASLWVAVACLASAAEVVPEGPLWQVELRSGERLAGDLRGLDDSLSLQLGGSRQERRIAVAAVARLWQPLPTPAGAGDLAFTLLNGDRLLPTAVVLADGVFEFDLGAAEPIRVRRAQVRQIRHAGADREVVSGLGALAEWAAGAPHWVATEGAFQARLAPAVLIRRDLLSERVRIALTLAAEPPPDLWLHLYGQAVGDRPGAGYALHLTGSEANLERHSASGAAVPIGSCRLVRTTGPEPTITLALAIDLPRGRFLLADATGPVADWTDPSPAAGLGRDLMLTANRPPMELRQVTVTQLQDAAALGAEPAAVPEADRVLLANGDVVAGELESIAAGVWTLRRGSVGRPLRLPAASVRLARLRLAAPATDPLALPTRIVLRGGSDLGVAAVRLAAGDIEARSPVWGTARFRLAALAEIRFGADPPRHPIVPP